MLNIKKKQKTACIFTGQVIKAAEDCARQYMNFMNVIFAAQKQVLFVFTGCFVACIFISNVNVNLFCVLPQNTLIDACVLDSDSGLLQQVLFCSQPSVLQPEMFGKTSFKS